MDKFTILLDAPTTPVNRMQVAEIGDSFRDPRYGEFAITHADVEEWAKNLAQLPGGRALIDEDHLSDKPSPHRRTEASGWITNLDVNIDSNVVMGDVHWTPKGEAAIKDQRYLFFSPAFGKFTNEKGETFDHTLTGGALTNKPFLTQMPVITLASASRLLEAARQSGEFTTGFTLDQAYEQGLVTLDISDEMREKHAVVVKEINGKKVHMFPIPPGDKVHARAALSLLPAAIKAGHINSAEAAEVRARANNVLGKKEMSDSRSQMDFDANTLKLLGITDEAQQKIILDLANADDADPTKVAQAIVKAQAEGGGGNGDTNKTLEEQAAAANKVLLDAGQVTQLMTDAQRGREAGTADATPPLEVTPEILTTLGITEDADQKKILDLAGKDDTNLSMLLGAIVGTRAAPVAPSDTKTLEQMAEAEGKVLLDAPQLAQLVAGATAGAEAKKQLEKQTFEVAFERNVRDGGKVVPAQKEQMEAFYALDADGTIKLMDDAPPKLTTRPNGQNVKPPDENMPDGVHQEGYELDSKVRSHMAETGETNYIKALETVTGVTVGA